MRIPEDLRPHLDDPRFWTRFFLGEEEASLTADDEDDDEFEGLSDLAVGFDLGDGHGLLLTMDVDIDHYTLSLPDETELGWDDDAHWHPHVLRAAELDLLCRAAAVADPAAAHPGVPLALLCRFAIVTEDAERDAVVPLLDAALGRLDAPFTAGEWLDGHDFRDAGVVWQHDPAAGTWTVEQRSEGDSVLYSLRTPDNDGFPSLELRDLLARAETVLETAFAPWREVAAAHADPEALVRALRDAGCDDPAILNALASAEPAERHWVLEELHGLERGSLVGRAGPGQNDA